MGKDNANHILLLVDNNISLLELLSKHLTMLDFRVKTANSGIAALDFLNNNSVDLVIADMDMPNMEGYYILNNLKTSRREIRVMLMTRNKVDKELFYKKGALELFTKPIDYYELEEKLILLLQDRRVTRRFVSNRILCKIKDTSNKLELNGLINNISLDGALLETNHTFQEKDKLQLEIYKPLGSSHIVAVCGQVIRSTRIGYTPYHQTAIFFDSTRKVDLLERFDSQVNLKNDRILNVT